MNILNRSRKLFVFGLGLAVLIYYTTVSASEKVVLRNLLDSTEESFRGSDRQENGVNFGTIEEEDGGDTQRPIMHTFFEPDPKGYCCGMLKDGHQRLLEAWENSWRSAGWDTKILTLEDAKKHKDFDALKERLSVLRLNEYNQKCYWRWLAMASIEGGGDGAGDENLGGGWMSDYDTFPLEFPGNEGRQFAHLSNGTFTTFSMHVPCLIYASREEWDRMLHLMMRILPEGPDSTATDMISLDRVAKVFTGSVGMWHDQIVKTFPYKKIEGGDAERLPYRRHAEYEDLNGERLVVDCDRCKGMRAVHLSHRAIMEAVHSGIYPDIDRKLGVINGRGEAGRVFLDDYREQCLQ